MSDEQISSAPQGADLPAGGVSAGALLRQAREASGLHVAALAVAMKVPVKKLEALEADRWDLLTDAVFIRGLASSVCRALKVDPTEVLAKLPQSTVPRLDSEVRGINAPFQSGRQNPVSSVSAYVSKPAVLLVFGLLLAAVVILLIPATHTTTTVTTSTAAAAAAVEPTPPQAQGLAVFASEPVSPPLPVSVPAVVASASAAPVPAVSTLVSVAPALAVVSAPAALGNGSIGFKAIGKSWVEVTDSRKAVLIRRSLVAGEKVEVTGALPLSVVIGAADAVTVEVHGKPFGLEQIAITNVARFEVK
jgi:cytoskeleton protein RodZ